MPSGMTDGAVVHIAVVSINGHKISTYLITIAPLSGKNVLMFGIILN